MGRDRIILGGGYKGSKGSLKIEKTKNVISGEEKTQIIVNGLDLLGNIINSYSEVIKEKEITKRIASKHEEEMKRLENELESILSEERKELEKIRKEFELNYKQLENEAEKNRLLAKIIQELISNILEIKEKAKFYEKEFGIVHPKVSELYDKLHELNITLTKQLPVLR